MTAHVMRVQAGLKSDENAPVLPFESRSRHYELRGLPLPVQALARRVLVRNGFVAISAFAILTGVAMLSWWPDSAADAPSAALQQAVTDSLNQNGATTPARVVRMRMTGWGDLTIEFVLRDLGGAQQNRAAALADVLAIARAVYQTAPPRPVNLTELGVWRSAVTGTSRVPVIYASLPADRLSGLDWTRVQPSVLFSIGVVRWLPAGICQAWHDCGANRG